MKLRIITTLGISFFTIPAQSVSALSSEFNNVEKNLEYAGPESDADKLINGQTWWKSWEEMTAQGIITEQQNCNSIQNVTELNTKQQFLISQECKEVIFVDTFNNEEGNALAPFAGVSEINGIAQLQKWNILNGNGITVRRGSSPLVGDFNNPYSYNVQLGSQNSGAMIATKGELAVGRGEYTLMFKVKERIGAGPVAKFAGVKAKVTGKDSIYAEKTHFIQTSAHNRLWSTVTIDFNVMLLRDHIKLSIEDVFNGASNEAAIIDTIILYKK